jgi:pimeloyl-ACP methyl ester carboxylesterase
MREDYGYSGGVESFQLGPLTAIAAGVDGPPIVFVSGPPFSAALFAAIQERLGRRRSVALELLSASARRSPLDLLRDALSELDGPIVVGHGLAVPLVLRCGAPRVVISNGPVSSLDPVTKQLSRLPARALEQLLRPGVLRTWMPSSAGLRRLVVNPYVMDHDMAVTLSAPWGEAPHSRSLAAGWIRGTPALVAQDRDETVEISAIWGDGDVLYPVARARLVVPDSRMKRVPGGRHLHPVERPWAFADALIELLEA